MWRIILRHKKKLLAGALTFLSIISCGNSVASPEVIQLFVGEYTIKAEMAATDEDKINGLMRRQALAPDHGMIFIFPQKIRACMWMKNTFMPLSVAFLDESGTIINIADMQPETETLHCADQPARFALEMQQDWFSLHKVMQGMQVTVAKRNDEGSK